MDLKKNQQKAKERESKCQEQEQKVLHSYNKMGISCSKQIYELEIEVKRQRLAETASTVSAMDKEKAQKMQELRKHISRIESEKRELQQSVHDLSQKCNFLQQETLQLDTKRLQAEKRVQECTSEITRLSDDLAEKGYGLKSD